MTANSTGINDVKEALNKTIVLLKEQIGSTYRLRGSDGFIAKYSPGCFDAPDDYFEIDFVDNDAFSCKETQEEENESPEIEEYHIEQEEKTGLLVTFIIAFSTELL